MKEHIENIFKASMLAKQATVEVLADDIAQAANALIHCLKQTGKILSCGNGGSAADAQHFSSELINRFDGDRPSLAALALTTDSSNLTSIANDYRYDYIFARQIEGLGREGDVLLAISTSGQSPSILEAVRTAQSKKMPVIALTGKDGGELMTLLSEQDIGLCVPHNATARIQECHLTIIHALCALIDKALFGQ